MRPPMPRLVSAVPSKLACVTEIARTSAVAVLGGTSWVARTVTVATT